MTLAIIISKKYIFLAESARLEPVDFSHLLKRKGFIGSVSTGKVA